MKEIAGVVDSKRQTFDQLTRTRRIRRDSSEFLKLLRVPDSAFNEKT